MKKLRRKLNGNVSNLDEEEISFELNYWLWGNILVDDPGMLSMKLQDWHFNYL